MIFQDDNNEYRRSFFYKIFMSNITKFISTNLRDGNKGTSEKLRYVRVSFTSAFHFSRTICFCIPINTFELHF